MIPRSQMLGGWGRFPVQRCEVFRPARAADISAAWTTHDALTFLPRGLGRSYGDNALNENNGILLTAARNRFLSFDERSGLLECESGVSLNEIIQTFLPRGWFIPVTPGTKYVTIGGAIANDVHGKNHHRDGTISRFIERLTVMLGTGQVVTCSPAQQPALFWATVGGIGLTGMILSAVIRLLPVESSYIEVEYHKAGNLEQALDLFERSDERFQYSVAWIDCLARGKQLGRSVLMQGNHAAAARIGHRMERYKLGKERIGSIPFDLPSVSLNPVTIGLFNHLYNAMHADGSRAVAHYDSFFYPLDAIGHWNRLYGKRGFVQYQFVLPPATARDGLVRILEVLSASKRSSFLAVLKSFGAQGEGWLSFPFRGYTLSLDIPVKDGLIPFLHALDELVLKHEGRIYLAKDSVMQPGVFAQMYPNLPAFRRSLPIWDPEHRWSSSQARRLGIVRGD